MDNNNDKVTNNPYNEEYYDNIVKEMLKIFHKNVFAVSTGTILLSITFIEKIVPSPNKNTLYILLFSWGFFILAIISSLVFHLSIYYIAIHQQNYLQNKRALENIENEDEDKIEKIIEKISKFKKSKFKTTLYIIEEFANLTSIISMILGIIFLITFSYKNLLYRAHKTTKIEYHQIMNYENNNLTKKISPKKNFIEKEG